MKEQIYCGDCGQKLVDHRRQKWDIETGVQLIGKHCPNLQCEEGCGWANHDMKFPYWSCKRCGYRSQDY